MAIEPRMLVNGFDALMPMMCAYQEEERACSTFLNHNYMASLQLFILYLTGVKARDIPELFPSLKCRFFKKVIDGDTGCSVAFEQTRDVSDIGHLYIDQSGMYTILVHSLVLSRVYTGCENAAEGAMEKYLSGSLIPIEEFYKAEAEIRMRFALSRGNDNIRPALSPEYRAGCDRIFKIMTLTETPLDEYIRKNEIPLAALLFEWHFARHKQIQKNIQPNQDLLERAERNAAQLIKEEEEEKERAKSKKRKRRIKKKHKEPRPIESVWNVHAAPFTPRKDDIGYESDSLIVYM